MKRIRTATVLAAIALLGSGCGGGGATTAAQGTKAAPATGAPALSAEAGMGDNRLVRQMPGGSEGSTRSVFELIRSRNAAVSRLGGPHRSLPEAMPQVRYIINGGSPVSVADAYFVGDLVSVEPGRSFSWTTDDDTERRHDVEFNSEGAQVSTIHMTFRIDRSIADPNQSAPVRRSLGSGKTITIGLALEAPVDIGAIRKELQEFKMFAALLYQPSPVFDYDKGLWAIINDGAFLGMVGEDGYVTFPAVDGPEKTDRAKGFIVSTEELEKPSGKAMRVTFDSRDHVYEPAGS